MQPLVIVGGGGHGRDILDVVDAMNASTPQFELLGFLDDDPDAGRRSGLTHLGPVSRLESVAGTYVIAIGDATARRRIDAMGRAAGLAAATLVHPSVTVGREVALGAGTVLMAGVRITNHVVLGHHVHVNQNSTIAHDCTLGDYATLSPQVALSGNVTVCEGAMVGTGAVVVPGVRLGARATVGAGAAVTQDVPDDTTVVGVPARPFRPQATPPA